VASDGGEGLGDIALEVTERLLEGVVRVIKAEDHVKEVVVADIGGECGLRLREVEEVAETLWSASTCVTP
jgi:trehalose utilization protein